MLAYVQWQAQLTRPMFCRGDRFSSIPPRLERRSRKFRLDNMVMQEPFLPFLGVPTIDKS